MFPKAFLEPFFHLSVPESSGILEIAMAVSMLLFMAQTTTKIAVDNRPEQLNYYSMDRVAYQPKTLYSPTQGRT